MSHCISIKLSCSRWNSASSLSFCGSDAAGAPPGVGGGSSPIAHAIEIMRSVSISSSLGCAAGSSAAFCSATCSASSASRLKRPASSRASSDDSHSLTCSRRSSICSSITWFLRYSTCCE